LAEDDFAVPVARAPADGDHAAAFFANHGLAPPANGLAVIQSQIDAKPSFEPVTVYAGRAPGWTGQALAARGDAPQPATSPTSASAAKGVAAKSAAAKPKGKPAKSKHAGKKNQPPKGKPAPKPKTAAR
jgi:hypothetical protein